MSDYKLLGRNKTTGAGVQVDPSTIASGNANNVIENVTCDSTVYVGAVVRMNVSGVALNALADDIATSNIIGVCESKASSILCNIRVAGVSDAIFTALDPTKNYYLSDTVAGGMVTTAPTTTGHVKVQVGQPFSALKMLVLRGDVLVRG